jgi:hypothetical protein
LTQAKAAGLLGVGIRFLSELERGKKSVELDLVLRVLDRLGFELAIAPRGARSFGTASVDHSPAPSTRAKRPAPEPSTKKHVETARSKPRRKSMRRG